MMMSFVQDVRYALRTLRHAPGFAASAITVLALGIGANTTVYSLLDAAFFRPLPYRAPSELVKLDNLDVPYDLGRPLMRKARAYFTDAAKLGVFSTVSAFAVGGLNIEDGNTPGRASIAYVTQDFFKTMAGLPRFGRVFSSDETSGGARVAVLSMRAARQQFGDYRDVIGKSIRLNTRRYVVVGIMPAEFNYPSDPDVWLPMQLPISSVEMFEAFKLYIPLNFVARLSRGQSPATAGAALAGLERQYPTWQYLPDSNAAALAQPLLISFTSNGNRTPLLILMAAAALVLLIACANFANLLLARATGRRRELAIRSAVGATRGRILQQLIVESLVVSSAGAVCGLVLAMVMKGVFTSLLPSALVAVAPPRVDARVVAFAVGVATLVGLVIGSIPGFAELQRDSTEAIKSGGSAGVTERNGTKARSILVVTELALALVLLTGSGLLVESFRSLTAVDTGLSTEHVVTAQVTLPTVSYGGADNVERFYRSTLAFLAHTPGIVSAAVVDALPLASQSAVGEEATAEGAEGDGRRTVLPLSYLVTPGYFATLKIMIRGRDFMNDETPGASVVINQTLATRLWPSQDALGKRVVLGQNRRTVVGVIANVRTRSLGDTATAQMYLPLLETGTSSANFVVRGSLPEGVIVARLRDAVRAVDRHQFVYHVRLMDDVVAESVSPQRTSAVLFSIFGAVALTLAGVGVYALLAYRVSQRRHEFAIRIALGAGRGDLLRSVFLEGARLAVTGVGIGLIATLILSRAVTSLLYLVTPQDPMMLTTAALILLMVAFLGTWVPALRATRVDAVDALRSR